MAEHLQSMKATENIQERSLTKDQEVRGVHKTILTLSSNHPRLRIGRMDFDYWYFKPPDGASYLNPIS